MEKRLFVGWFIGAAAAGLLGLTALPHGMKKESSASIAAREYGLSDFQTVCLRCIRLVENGRAGREYGVLHPAARDTNELTQARWAAGTIRKWLHAPSALKEFARRWAPIGADNDPQGLNRYWLANMHACLES